jgi:peptide/nickel transport system permease protein
MAVEPGVAPIDSQSQGATPGAPARGSRTRAILASPSLRLLGRRLLSAIPVLWGVTFLTFVIMNLLPGDAASQILGATATPADVRALEIKLHLNEPFWVRYGHWLGGVVHGYLGESLRSGQTVASTLVQRLPVTFELLLYAFIVSAALAVIVAVLAARKPNGFFDRLSMTVSMIGLSTAPYVLALVLVYVFAVRLRIFPAIGFVPLTQSVVGNIKSLTLPAISIGLALFSVYTRLLRADILEQMQSEDYVVTAKAKGVPPRQVLVRHALRNSMFGFVTIVGLNLGALVGAVVVIEPIFSLPGIGQALLQAISDRDLPVVEGIVLVFAVVVVLGNLLTDVMYAVLDPRIRYGRAGS